MHVDVSRRGAEYVFCFTFSNPATEKAEFPAPVRLSVDDLEDSLVNVREVLAKIAGSPVFASRLEGDDDEFLDQDGGILLRAARSPYRIANLDLAVRDGDQNGLKMLASHARVLFGCGHDSARTVESLAASFVSTLARTAACLFSEGILHGQLNAHCQNVTLAAELADFDGTVFLRSKPDCTLGVPFAESPWMSLYLDYPQRLRRAEQRFQTQVMRDWENEYEQYAGNTYDGLAPPLLAASMLLQVVILCNHALRAADLLERGCMLDHSRPDTVPDHNRLRGLRRQFARVAAQNLRVRRSLPLLHWCIEHGSGLLAVQLNERGREATHGLTAPSTACSCFGPGAGSLPATSADGNAEQLLANLLDGSLTA